MSGNYLDLPWEGRKLSIVVIGDLILDEYLDGSVNRISPEAPVPVHLVSKSEATAGGAANVARNLQLVGVQAVICGVCGNDGAGDQLKQILKKDGVDTKNILIDYDRPTVRKTRVTANHQQLVRIDWEQTAPISQQLQDQLLGQLLRLDFDAILVSDYGKGALTSELLAKVIDLAKKRSKPIIVDPKGKNYTRYAGASLITPNRKEACEALGLEANDTTEPQKLARDLQAKFSLNNVLVTLGAQGMFGLEAETDDTHHLPAQTREVFDVSGAGDTVVAIMAICAALEMPLRSAMGLANLAAGCVVEKWGTQPILKEELRASIKRQSIGATHSSQSWRPSSDKVYADASALLQRLNQHEKKKKRRLVFTNGCFDILHAGHISYLEKARQKGDALIVAVNTDSSVRKLKGPSRPIITCEQRMLLLAALESVSFVVAFDEDTPQKIIETLMPDVLVKGADYEISEIVGADTVARNGGQVERIDFVEGLSTSDIVDRVKTGRGVPVSENDPNF